MTERSDLRRLRESGIPIDMTGPARVFAIGAVGGSASLIPREDWPKEIAAKAAEESEFWKGRYVSIQLIVELPFWIMIPDCEISLSHDEATVQASIRGKYMAVSDGPFSFDSHCNVIFVGPKEKLAADQEPPLLVALSKAPVQRLMKTVIVFQPVAKEDAVLALQGHQDPALSESARIRRINRAQNYLQSLAYAHIPFLNTLISSYRITSHDPFAFQVSQWDVPIWFAELNGKFARVSLMPYWEQDWFPTLYSLSRSDRSPIHLTDHKAISAQAETSFVPGLMEILDARSLYFRGHIDSAVRSAVTAIEIVLETQISKLLSNKGWSKQRILDRLEETWNNFDKRLADYEKISETRIPGPILSPIPYINGIRFKSELNQVRELRHKIVHHGLRVDIHSRGPMLRAIETMTWLFQWLSWEKGKSEDKTNYYAYFEMQRGMNIPRYSIRHCDSGVVVLPDNNKKKKLRLMTNCCDRNISRQLTVK
ncbi:MAG: hypothetical protein JXM70_04720 [Pirellulales bacterium]|nr:hypothetical protein [Pirellulales bacterium]